MDERKFLPLGASGDVPSMLALMTFLGLWGFIACTAAIYCTSFGH
jgi:hypothetical protein